MGLGQIRKLQQEAKKLKMNPTESEMLRPWAMALAETELSIRDAALDVEAAADVDVDLDEAATVDDRADELLEFVGALLNQRVTEHYVDEHLGLDNPSAATAYVGLPQDEWEGQIDQWAETYRTKAPGATEEFSDRELAENHVEGKFGVDLSTFEREVVALEESEAMRHVTAGSLEETEHGLAQIADHLENDTESNS